MRDDTVEVRGPLETYPDTDIVHPWKNAWLFDLSSNACQGCSMTHHAVFAADRDLFTKFQGYAEWIIESGYAQLYGIMNACYIASQRRRSRS